MFIINLNLSTTSYQCNLTDCTEVKLKLQILNSMDVIQLILNVEITFTQITSCN